MRGQEWWACAVGTDGDIVIVQLQNNLMLEEISVVYLVQHPAQNRSN